jgi:diadenosine tetraphosphate (Ap4A) HIT family hydrolase
VDEFGGRLTSDPNRSSLGLLPSGPDPVGEWLVHRQPPGLYIGGTERECKRRPQAMLAFHRTRKKREKLTEFLTMIEAPPQWSLHPQLAKDTIHIGDLPLSRVLLINDANYPWLLLVPRRIGVSEMIDLDEVEQAQLWTEIARTGRALKTVTECDKLNIAALGNVVPQLHVHVIARRAGDAAWPKPVWGAVPPVNHDKYEADRFIAELRRRLWVE